MSVLCPILTIFNRTDTMAAIYRSRVMSYDNNGNGRATQTPPPPPPSSTSTDVTSAVTCTTSSVTSVDTTSTVSQRVRRRLFHDDPTDSNANAEIARIEMENIQRQQSQKYNFDFSRGIPINDPSGAYEWQQLTPTVSSIQYSGSEPTSTSEQIESIERPSIELTPIVIESPSTSGITSEGGSCSASTSSIWTTKATSMTSNTPPLLLTATTTYRSQPSLLDTFQVVKSGSQKRPLSKKRKVPSGTSSTSESSVSPKKSKPSLDVTCTTCTTVTTSTVSSSKSTAVHEESSSSS